MTTHAPLAKSNDLSRDFFLDVTADGAVFIRARTAKLTDGALPVFSTDTLDEAEMLRVRHCRLARDGSGVYRLNETPRDVDDLTRVSDLFRSAYDRSPTVAPGAP